MTIRSSVRQLAKTTKLTGSIVVPIAGEVQALGELVDAPGLEGEVPDHALVWGQLGEGRESVPCGVTMGAVSSRPAGEA